MTRKVNPGLIVSISEPGQPSHLAVYLGNCFWLDFKGRIALCENFTQDLEMRSEKIKYRSLQVDLIE